MCPKCGCTEWAAIAGLRDPSLEAPKAPCCAPDPSNVVWPVLAVLDGGKSVTRSGSVTSLPKPYPSLHPPCPDMKQDYGGEKVPEAPPAQTNCSRESLSRSECLFYKLSLTDASQARLNFLFFLNINAFPVCLYVIIFLDTKRLKKGKGWGSLLSPTSLYLPFTTLCQAPEAASGASICIPGCV